MAETDSAPEINTEELCKEYRFLKATRSAAEQTWDQIERFFDPLGSGGRPYVNLQEQSVEWRRPDEPWDSTPIDASSKLAAYIHGTVTPPAVRWCKGKWRDRVLQDDRDASAWLDAAIDKVFLALQDSDFNTEKAASNADLVHYGNSFITEEVADEFEWKGVDFGCVAVRDGYVRLNSQDYVDRFYRKLFWTPVQMKDLCDKKGWTAPQDILDACKDADAAGKREEFVFCVFTRPEMVKRLTHMAERNRQRGGKRLARRKALEHADKQYDPTAREQALQAAGPEVEQDEVTHPIPPLYRPVGGVYFREKDGLRIGEEQGYYEMPVYFTRWAKTPGSIWGHGPCHTQLAAAKTLNALVELVFLGLAKMVDPVTLITERGLIGDLNMGPGQVNVVRDLERSMKAFTTEGRPDLAQAMIESLREQIARGLMNDLLTLKDSPEMSATEAQERFELMNRHMGSPLGRIEHDELSPIIKATLGHLYRAGQLPPLPEAVQQAYADKPPQFDIEYQGPLARAQRTDEVAAIERGLAVAKSILETEVPAWQAAVKATVNAPAAIRRIFQLLGTPADVLNGEKEVAAAMSAFDRQEQAAAAAAQEQAAAAADADRAKAAQMRAQVTPAPDGASEPAQPTPIVSPAFGPAAPFTQPAPGM